MLWVATLALLGAPELAPMFSLEQALQGLESKGRLYAHIETSLGPIDVQLHEDRAPKTVASFVGLVRGRRAFVDPKTGEKVRRPFYDGLTFHRRVPGFVIQGGCPLGDGKGGPGWFIQDEPHPTLQHDQPGVVVMARSSKPHTNGSQFYITESPQPHLDNYGYSVFGQVVTGMNVVHAIARSKEPVTILKVTVSRE